MLKSKHTICAIELVLALSMTALAGTANANNACPKNDSFMSSRACNPAETPDDDSDDDAGGGRAPSSALRDIIDMFQQPDGENAAEAGTNLYNTLNPNDPLPFSTDGVVKGTVHYMGAGMTFSDAFGAASYDASGISYTNHSSSNASGNAKANLDGLHLSRTK